MTTVQEAKDRGKELHLTNAYNFAGPGTFFKARMKGSEFYEELMNKSGRKLIGTKPYNVPINKLDTCAVAHDTVYANPNSTGDEVQAADKKFQECISKIKISDGIEEKFLAIAGKAGFDAKLAVENTGLVRKGSLSDGGAKQSGFGSKIGSMISIGKQNNNSIRRGMKFK